MYNKVLGHPLRLASFKRALQVLTQLLIDATTPALLFPRILDHPLRPATGCQWTAL